MQALARAWQGRGPLACALWPLSLLYHALTAARRALYRAGWLQAQAMPVPVVVVGNLIAGGAGKTPTVLAIVELLRHAGWRPGIVSRGYGRAAGGVAEVGAASAARDVGDEPLLLRRRSCAPVFVARDRPLAAQALLQAHPEVDVIVSDDGLQHLPLARDVEVLVFDDRGVGNGWLLPAGPLREPLPARLGPAQLVLYNAAAPTTPLPGTLARRGLAGAVRLADWWDRAEPSMAALQSLAGRPVLAAAGMAAPERFFAMLREAGLQPLPLPLPDHHDFDTLPWPEETSEVLVTEKDAVKLRPARCGVTRVWVVTLDFRPDAGFADSLLQALEPRRR